MDLAAAPAQSIEPAASELYDLDAISAALAQVAEQLTQSSNPLDQILSLEFAHASQETERNITAEQLQRLAGMQPRSEAVLVWLIEHCTKYAPGACPMSELVAALRAIAPDNVIAWLLPEPEEGQSYSVTRLQQAATASRHQATDMLLMAAKNQALIDFSGLDSSHRAFAVIGLAVGMPLPFAWVGDCRGRTDQADVLAACTQLAALVYRTGATMLDKTVGAATARWLSPEGSSAANAWQRKRDDLQTLLHQYSRVDCALKVDAVADQYLKDWINAGETFAMQNLVDSGTQCGDAA